jgi:hypothetical protein
MNRRMKTVLIFLILLLFSTSLGASEKPGLNKFSPIQIDQIESIRPPAPVDGKYFCYLEYTNWNAAWFFDQWRLGDKVAIYFDPSQCGYPSNYPFQLSHVDLVFYDFAGMCSVDVQLSVEVVCPDVCDGPGIEIYKSPIYTVTRFYPWVETIFLSDTVCLDKPFFLNVEYTSDYPIYTMPSLAFDAQMVDTCYQWLWLGQPGWWEWYDIWEVVPGWALVGLGGDCGEEHTSCGEWYFKPDTLPQAPSGVPDFDQNQDDWVAYCGPTAVANCLWWYDAVPQGMTPPELIELLAAYFNTGSGGTAVEDIEAGLEQYFHDYGFALKESTFWMPDFHEMEDSLKKCQDIILLLGFWWYDEGAEQGFKRGDVDGDGMAATVSDLTTLLHGPPFPCDDAADINDDGMLDTLDGVDFSDYFVYGDPLPPPFPGCGYDPTLDQLDCATYAHCPGQWWREGGHYITMAGVNSEKREIAISDPDRDQCESVPGWPGRVLPLGGHPPHTGDPYVHNDPQMVSHDIYISLLHPEFPSPGSDNWDLADYCYQPGRYSGLNVPERFEASTQESPKHFEYWHSEVEAAIMICPRPNGPPEIGQPDFLEGYVDDMLEYEITGDDPDGDVISDEASITILPGCGEYWISRISGHGTSSGTWQVTWVTSECTPCDTHMVIHDLTDTLGATGYCTTYVHLSETPGWYWKDPYPDYAPSGMPDIDQRQDTWKKSETEQWTFCGPCAVANCFKWFDSKYNVPPGSPGDGQDQFPLVRDYLDELMPLVGYDDHDPWNVDNIATLWSSAVGSPPPTDQPFIPGPQIPGGGLPPWGELVERLAWYFDTDGIQTGYCQHAGSNILQMQEGIQRWLESEMFEDSSTLADTLCVVLTPMPTFAYVESLVEKCEDVILLLGFWYNQGGPGEREFKRGDVDGNGMAATLTDLMACLDGPPFPCDDAADVNDDGILDSTDCQYLADYCTVPGHPPPPPPFPNCGTDPNPDALGCADYPHCPGSGDWFRIGGHYVTVAGVNSQEYMIAFSDPFIDNAELGFAGRVGDGILMAHPHGSHHPTLHNDEGNVSHDIYTVAESPSPGGLWGLPEYAMYHDLSSWMWNFHAQNVPNEFVPVTAPWDQESYIFTEVEYCVHVSPWDYRGDVNIPYGDGTVDAADVVFLINYLFRGGDPPVPYIEGDTNCDGTVSPGDVVSLINYLYKGWPPPRCCK